MVNGQQIKEGEAQGLIVICGPTATGKSGVALELAQRLGTVILSADSRACYQAFDIGTAKPSIADRQQVPHYLIDICPPTDTLTVADYQHRAQSLIAQFHTPPLPITPLLVGGTGLYIRAIVQGLKIPRVPPQMELRSQLQSFDQIYLSELLQQVDPISTQKIHANDRVRTLRALEVFYITGQPISSQQGEQPPRYPILQIGLDCADTTALAQRIDRRTEQMLDAGLVKEVATLCEKYGADLPLLNTLGYQEIKQYLAGDCSLAEAKAKIVLHTRQFAKRQRTWFHAYPEIEWFDADYSDVIEQIWRRVKDYRQL